MHIGYIICVPLATWRIISQNKPRGSSEDADYTFDMEGNKVKFTEEMYQVAMKRMKDKKDKTLESRSMFHLMKHFMAQLKLLTLTDRASE